MHNRSVIQFVCICALVVITGISHAADNNAVPEIRSGEVLLCEPHPFRTVGNTSRTVYQIARLGFSSVRSFQQAHRLDTDDIIGPKTQQRAESEYQRAFGKSSLDNTNSTTLTVTIQPRATAAGITTTVAINGEAARQVRVIGSLTFSEGQGFAFTKPSVLLQTKTCLRHGGLTACGGRSALVVLTGDETGMIGDTTQPELAVGEFGRLAASVTYLGADLVERVTEARLTITSEMKFIK